MSPCLGAASVRVAARRRTAPLFAGAAALLSLSASCVGVGGGAMAGVSRSSAGQTGATLEAPVGLLTRGYSSENLEDRAILPFFGLVPRLSYQAERGFGGGVAAGLGGAYYAGRVGVASLVTIGMLADASGTRLALRLMVGPELELGASDWRIDEVDPCNSFVSSSFVPRVRRHALVGLFPAVEYLGSSGSSPREWVFSLFASFRGMFEPGC